MKTKTISSLIALGLFGAGCFVASQITGCATGGGLTPQATSAIKVSASALLIAAKTYQAIGTPGLPVQYKSLYDGLTSAAAQLQTQVGQPANPTVINTGTPAVDAAIIAQVTPGAPVTQADVTKLAIAATLATPSASPNASM